MASGTTQRSRAKAKRQEELLAHAARLFADRGYSGVSLEELGAAVGVSGPAVYRHFAKKQILLGTILVRACEGLRDGGREVCTRSLAPADRVRELIRFHVDFALSDADVIRVHDRELASLHDDDRHTVRRLQREYVELWVGALAALHPDRSEEDLRVRAHACFGLINSTPHVTRDTTTMPDEQAVRGILESMAFAALVA